MIELNDRQQLLREFCDRIVPGSAPTGPERYVLGLAAGLPDDQRVRLEAAITTVTTWVAEGVALSDVQHAPEFGRLRALVIEAYYSGYRQPGYTGPDGWDVTGFVAAPMARMAVRDFAFLPVLEDER